jgi:hypothetical protein
MTITITASALLLVSAGLFLWGALFEDGGAVALVPAILIGAVMWLAWRTPGRAGVLLLLFSPVGFFLLALGSTSNDPQSQVILGFLCFVGIPLVSGVLLVIADLLLPKAHEKATGS